MGQLLYLEDHLYRLRTTNDQVLNPEEHHVLFCPILKKYYYIWGFCTFSESLTISDAVLSVTDPAVTAFTSFQDPY
jgi:hypothetical protein